MCWTIRGAAVEKMVCELISIFHGDTEQGDHSAVRSRSLDEMHRTDNTVNSPLAAIRIQIFIVIANEAIPEPEGPFIKDGSATGPIPLSSLIGVQHICRPFRVDELHSSPIQEAKTRSRQTESLRDSDKYSRGTLWLVSRPRSTDTELHSGLHRSRIAAPSNSTIA
jgi:hypothetical protein